MTNKFAPTCRSLESINYFFGSYMTNGCQRVNLCHFRDAQRPREIYQLDSALESLSRELERTLSTLISASNTNRYLHEDDRHLDPRATPMVILIH